MEKKKTQMALIVALLETDKGVNKKRDITTRKIVDKSKKGGLYLLEKFQKIPQEQT